MLSGGAIAGIAIVSIISFVLICFGVYYVIRKRQRDAEYLDRCSRLWTKNRSSSYMAKFPYADTSYVRTPVPGQQFTARELKGSPDFVLPQRSKYEQGNEDLAEMEGKSLISMYTPIDPGSINPNLYNSDADDKEMTSSNSDVKQPPQVFFSLEFDEKFDILKVYIDQARFLKPKLCASTCDPYCSLTLLPGKVEKKTMIVRRTVDPIFQEYFSFEVPKQDLEHKSIQIKFFNYDQYSRDECTGVVVQRLNEVNLESKVDLWKKIQPISVPNKKGSGVSAGDILIRLGYLPSAEKLTVVLLKARGLPEVGSEEDKKPPDPYIRVAVYHEGNLLKKKKTSTKKRTCHPTYNQAINFPVPLDVLPQLEIHFHVVHDLGVKINRAERKESIGCLEIGPTSSGEEFDHWRDLMSNKPQARWHQLSVPVSSEQ